MYMYIHIYIYIYRERERDVYMYIYTYISALVISYPRHIAISFILVIRNPEL